MTIRAIDVDVQLTVEDPVLDGLLRVLLKDLRAAFVGAPSVPPAAHVEIVVRGANPWTITSPEYSTTAARLAEAVSAALTAVNLTAISATNTLAIHAAVVARHGTAIALPGRSGLGKTTTCAALLAGGWEYVSDEALCLRWDDGQLVPYPRPLALSPWAADRFGVLGIAGDGEVIVGSAAFGARPAVGNLRIEHIVLLERDGQQPQLRGVARTDALTALLQRGFSHHRRPALAMELAAQLCQRSQTWQLSLGDPARAADLVTREFDPEANNDLGGEPW